MSRSYAKVYRSLWEGTLVEHWEGWATLVFLLAHCDPDGTVDLHPRAIVRKSGLPADVVARGLAILEAEDPESRSSAESGRRLVRIDPAREWGWRIVNHASYRAKDAAERQADWRARHPDAVEAEADRKRETRAASRGVTGRNHAVAEAEADSTSPLPTTKDVGAEPSAPSPASEPELPLGGVAGERERAVRGRSGAGTSGDPRRNGSGSYEAVIAMPLNTGREYVVTRPEVEEWRRLYPAVDVDQELRAMRGWLLANPERRKTVKGMPRFINGWLADEQNKARPAAPGRRPGGFRADADARYKNLNPGVDSDR